MLVKVREDKEETFQAFFDGQLKKPGDKFTITEKTIRGGKNKGKTYTIDEQFCGEWMEKVVESKEPKKTLK